MLLTLPECREKILPEICQTKGLSHQAKGRCLEEKFWKPIPIHKNNPVEVENSVHRKGSGHG